jgi:hypothetical protein
VTDFSLALGEVRLHLPTENWQQHSRQAQLGVFVASVLRSHEGCRRESIFQLEVFAVDMTNE